MLVWERKKIQKMPLSELSMSNKTKALLAILFVSVFNGANSPYVKLVLKLIPPFSYTFIRFSLSFLLILPFYLRTKPKFRKNSFRLILLSLFSSLNIILFVFGIRLTLASIGQVIYSFQPIVVIMMSYFLLKENITFKKIIGIIIGFLGINLVIFLPLLDKNIFNKEAVFGNFLIMIGCLFFSYYTTASKKFLEKYPPLTLTTAFIFTTALITLFFSLFEFSSFNSWFSQINLITLWAIFYTVVIGTVVAYFLQQYAIHHGSPLIASLIQYIAPGSTMIWSNIILGERFNLALIGGTIITLFGAWLVTKET